MVSVIIDAAIDAAIDVVVDTVADAVVDTVTDEVTDIVVEEVTETITDEVVSTVEAEVEETVEEEVEEEVETEIEQELDEEIDKEIENEDPPSEDGPTKWTPKSIAKAIAKVLAVAGAINFVVSQLVAAGSKPPPGATPAQKAEISKLTDAATRLQSIFGTWKSSFDSLKNLDLGVYQKVPVVNILSSILTVMQSTAQKLQKSLAKGVTVDNLKSTKTMTFNLVSCVKAICDLRDKTNLKLYKFPIDKTITDTNNIIDTDFPDVKAAAEKEAQGKISNAVRKLAKEKATAAVAAKFSPQIKKSVIATAKKKVLPKAKSVAVSAGTAAAKKEGSSIKKKAMKIGLIPFYGWAKAIEMAKTAKSKCKSAGKAAAKAALNDYMQHTGNALVKTEAKSQTTSTLTKNKAEVASIAKAAAQKVIDQHQSLLDKKNVAQTKKEAQTQEKC